MRKIVVSLFVLVMSISLCACGGGNKKAFERSKIAYEKIDAAYEITEQFGTDIYEAWRMGIYEKSQLQDTGLAHFSTNVNLSESDLSEGLGTFLTRNDDMSWEEVSAEDRAFLIDNANMIFTLYEDDLFTLTVQVVTNAYNHNGKVAEAKAALDEAKEIMKELSENYSDYEHYPNLKGYYTTTSSFFDFCQNPSGSFEQITDTINEYKNEARDYNSDLDYIFE